MLGWSRNRHSLRSGPTRASLTEPTDPADLANLTEPTERGRDGSRGAHCAQSPALSRGLKGPLAVRRASFGTSEQNSTWSRESLRVFEGTALPPAAAQEALAYDGPPPSRRCRQALPPLPRLVSEAGAGDSCATGRRPAP